MQEVYRALLRDLKNGTTYEDDLHEVAEMKVPDVGASPVLDHGLARKCMGTSEEYLCTRLSM